MDERGGAIRKRPKIGARDLALLRVLLGPKAQAGQPPAPAKAKRKIKRKPEVWHQSGRKGAAALAKRRRRIAEASRRRNRSKE